METIRFPRAIPRKSDAEVAAIKAAAAEKFNRLCPISGPELLQRLREIRRLRRRTEKRPLAA